MNSRQAVIKEGIMVLHELLIRKRFLDKKIHELKNHLHRNSENDKLASQLFSFLDEKQNILIRIEDENTNRTITIGSTDVSVSTAVKVRKTLHLKIKVITDLLNDENCSLDPLALIKQRDGFVDELMILNKTITKNDLEVEVK